MGFVEYTLSEIECAGGASQIRPRHRRGFGLGKSMRHKVHAQRSEHMQSTFGPKGVQRRVSVALDDFSFLKLASQSSFTS